MGDQEANLRFKSSARALVAVSPAERRDALPVVLSSEKAEGGAGL